LPWAIVNADPPSWAMPYPFPWGKQPVRMAVRPPRDQLKEVVKLSDGGASANMKTTPDQGTDAVQGNLESVLDSICRVEHGACLADSPSPLPSLLFGKLGSVRADQSRPGRAVRWARHIQNVTI